MNLTRRYKWWTSAPFKKGIRFFFWGVIMPHSSWKLRDILGTGRLGRLGRKIFPPSMRPLYDYWNFYMNEEKAKYIDSLYATHRALSRDFKAKYPETNVDSECQMDGQSLRRCAEDYWKYWLSRF